MRKTVFATLAGAAALFVGVQAQASTVVDGKCVSVSADAGCLFNGNITGNDDPTNVNSYLNAQNAYNLYNNTHPSADPDIALSFILATGDDYFDAGETSGTWSLPGYTVDFIAVKAGDQFVLYDVVPGASSGEWSTAGLTNPKGQLKGLSHLVFFGSPTAVPEPATWAMMIAGFGLTGAAMRRRKARIAVTYA